MSGKMAFSGVFKFRLGKSSCLLPALPKLEGRWGKAKTPQTWPTTFKMHKSKCYAARILQCWCAQLEETPEGGGAFEDEVCR